MHELKLDTIRFFRLLSLVWIIAIIVILHNIGQHTALIHTAVFATAVYIIASRAESKTKNSTENILHDINK